MSRGTGPDILETIGEAIGQALRENGVEFSMFGDSPIEEHQRPETDMIEDDSQIRKMLGKGNRVIEAIPLENRKPEEFIGVVSNQKIDENYQIDYCIDGSLRTKYMGEVLSPSGGTGAPFVVSHVGAAAVRLDYPSGRVQPEAFNLELGLYVPGPGILPDSAYQRIQSLSNSLKNLYVEALEAEETESELRLSAGGKVRNRMHELENGVIESLPEGRRWTLIDGALRGANFYNLPRTIGVAKSFSHKVIFSAEDGHRPRTISHLSRLPRFSRSPMYRYRVADKSKEDLRDQGLSKLGFFYLRIRSPPPEMEPMGGIVKIDLPYHGQSPEEMTEIANQISRAVLRIANPSIFPRPRWPSFLYPVRVTEEYLSEALYTANHFMRLGLIIRSVMTRS